MSPSDKIFKQPFALRIPYHSHRHKRQRHFPPATMRDFPQELTEIVIDRLAEPDRSLPRIPHRISSYSLVSRQWVRGAQKHHFELLHLDSKGMDKWVTEIDPSPFGVSKHVRTLHLDSIESLDEFEDHIRALTKVKIAAFWCCDFFCCLDDVQLITRGLGGSLVDLELDCAQTTPEILVSLLAGLPKLCRFHALTLTVDVDERAPVPSTEGIRFFEGGSDFRILLEDGSEPGQLAWVPPNAKFSSLGIGLSCMYHGTDLVDTWVRSSGETLRCFALDCNVDGTYPSIYRPI